jgi:hypothetical protein
VADAGYELEAGSAAFGGVERVIAASDRFKAQLHIGEDAYAVLRVGKALRESWDMAGVAWTGGAIAASSTVANTFVASTASGGLLSLIGLGTAAATPVGWVAAAAIASGGAYWGVMRTFAKTGDQFVVTIPKFINTPLDLLGAGLFDMMGALVMRIAAIDGHIDEGERALIREHFVEGWGYDADYVARALPVIESGAHNIRVKQATHQLADYLEGNPDCNAAAMQKDLIILLHDLAMADGVFGETEELAIDAVERIFRERHEFSLRNLRRSVVSAAETAGSAASTVANKASRMARGIAGRWRSGAHDTST